MNHLSIRELIDIANAAGVLKRMSAGRTNRVVVDHVPARPAMSIPREIAEEDGPLEPAPLEVIPITFTLADAMFGGTVFVALTCGNRVLVNPFPWTSYEHLGTVTITAP